MKKINITIDRIEGEIAILKTENNTINFPTSLLPDNIKEGDILNLIITTDQEKTGQEKQKAKALLNEILNNSS